MSDIATPGPLDPISGQPDHHAEVSALKMWLRQNMVSLIVTIAAVVAVWVFWDPITAIKVVIGLGLVIFLHELGHFLAAKWCDVHVKTFSIGFGPAVPFCSYKWGETTYMLGIIPLGGYVSMVGEGTGESTPDGDPDDDDDDPRSFKNKRVGQRMLIISAGVVMNIILGMGCFVAAYMHGVREKPATVGNVESGSAAWRAGIRTGADIKKIGSRENPFFDDIRPIVMSTVADEKLPIVVDQPGPNGARVIDKLITAEPLRDEGVLFPQLGVAPPLRLTLEDYKKAKTPPVVPGSPAARATGGEFERGDRIVGMTDPAKPGQITPIPPAPNQSEPDYNEYYRRMVLLAEQPVTFQVLRRDQPADGQPVEITVEPAFRSDLGIRWQMGKVAAVRAGGPAEGNIEAVPINGAPTAAGDRIAAVGVTSPDGKTTWFANGNRPAEAAPDDPFKPLDPILLPSELARWAGEYPPNQRSKLEVKVVVLREIEHTEKRKLLTLGYDDSFRYDRESVNNLNSPLPISGLGLAYWVEAVVNHTTPGSPADQAKLSPNDVVTAFRYKPADGNGKPGDWVEIKPHQWAAVESVFQHITSHEIELRVKQAENAEKSVEVTLTGQADTTRGLPNRGMIFDYDVRTQLATGVGNAIQLGAYRTVRFIKTIYQGLYGMAPWGRVSLKTLSGPLTIANVSYKLAGEDFWQFLLFLGLISVNLAVVNFLPIPVLDGGHMVFLIIEWVLGRPVPERIFAAATWVGLIMILCLFVWVIFRDIDRLFL